jgi:hypothetical protein
VRARRGHARQQVVDHAGSTSPSNGQPKATLTVPATRRARRDGALDQPVRRRAASSRERLTFARANASVAITATWTCARPPASARFAARAG